MASSRESLPDKKNRTTKIIKKLHELYPDAKCSLDHKNPFQLLISTVLSAQCTDARVNKVTPALFQKYPNAQDMAAAPLEDLEELIRSTGFFKNKAKSLKASSQTLTEKYKGQVPKTMDELTALPGVGRKTANVVLGNAFGIPSMVVDTHVTRLSNRLGWVKTKDATKIEKELESFIPEKEWTDLAHLLIYHGRAVCGARGPHCRSCAIFRYCPRVGLPKEVS